LQEYIDWIWIIFANNKIRNYLILFGNFIEFIHTFTDKKYYFFWCANCDLDRMLVANRGHKAEKFIFRA